MQLTLEQHKQWFSYMKNTCMTNPVKSIQLTHLEHGRLIAFVRLYCDNITHLFCAKSLPAFVSFLEKLGVFFPLEDEIWNCFCRWGASKVEEPAFMTTRIRLSLVQQCNVCLDVSFYDQSGWSNSLLLQIHPQWRQHGWAGEVKANCH